MKEDQERISVAEMVKGIIGKTQRVAGTAPAPKTEEEKTVMRLKGYEPSTLDEKT
jgi:hypothetical protein